MSKKLIYALVLIAVVTVIAIMTDGSMSLNLIFDQVRMDVSLGLFLFAGAGVVIGLVLK